MKHAKKKIEKLNRIIEELEIREAAYKALANSFLLTRSRCGSCNHYCVNKERINLPDEWFCNLTGIRIGRNGSCNKWERLPFCEKDETYEED